MREYFNISKQENQKFFRSLLFEKYKSHFNPSYFLEYELGFGEFGAFSVEQLLSRIESKSDRNTETLEVPKERPRPKKKTKHLHKMSKRKLKMDKKIYGISSLTMSKTKHSGLNPFAPINPMGYKSARNITMRTSKEADSFENLLNKKKNFHKKLRINQILNLPNIANSRNLTPSICGNLSNFQSKRSLHLTPTGQMQISQNLVSDLSRSESKMFPRIDSQKYNSFISRQYSKKGSERGSNTPNCFESLFE